MRVGVKMCSWNDLYKTLSLEMNIGHKAVLLTELNARKDGPAELNKSIVTESELKAVSVSDDKHRKIAKAALETGKLQFLDDKQGSILFAEPFFPESRLVILGGGHIAKPLAEFSAKCGFSVTVVDDRPSFANSERFPYAEKVICEGFERCFPLLEINRFAFVVIITRGHRHDLDCLRQVLRLETAYTGMIGSRRRVRAAMDQMLEEGFSKDSLAAVNSPIGLDIDAQTPEEISISILSQLIKYKRQLAKANWPELDRDVLAELSEETHEPRALITIVETKGSVPRDIGAKMIVWPYGKIIGSIGGGCSESAVIQTAIDIIREGGCKTQDIDMTGDTAADEGMVCGGTMRVFIERID
jgi:xanthine dehydrogenase accessory factor